MILCEASLSADRAVRQADIPPLREVPDVLQYGQTDRAGQRNLRRDEGNRVP